MANKENAEFGTESKYPLIGQNKQIPKNVNAKNIGNDPIITFTTSGVAISNVLEITV